MADPVPPDAAAGFAEVLHLIPISPVWNPMPSISTMIARLVRAGIPAICLAVATTAQAIIPTYDTYYSPKNGERPKRASTRFIILHTTEGPAKGSGNKK